MCLSLIRGHEGYLVLFVVREYLLRLSKYMQLVELLDQLRRVGKVGSMLGKGTV